MFDDTIQSQYFFLQNLLLFSENIKFLKVLILHSCEFHVVFLNSMIVPNNLSCQFLFLKFLFSWIYNLVHFRYFFSNFFERKWKLTKKVIWTSSLRFNGFIWKFNFRFTFSIALTITSNYLNIILVR